ncbi:MAG: hypothetical protein OEY38_21925 [Gammaproteobacteria bacterium]|nr:hypothetical protein [Gammaproteobacteria bacterium]
MGGIKKALLFVLIFSISGCASLNGTNFDINNWFPKKEKPKPKPVVKHKLSDGKGEAESKINRDILTRNDAKSDDYLHYYQQLVTLSKRAQLANLQRMEDIYKKNKSIKNGILYVLSLVVTGEDNQKALQVLEDVQSQILQEPRETRATAFTQFLWDMVKQNVALSQDNDLLKTEISERNKQAALLEKQINALKNIEKNITDREVGIVTENR